MSVHPGRGAGRRPARSGQHARRAARVGEPRGGPARALPGFPGRLRGAVMTVLIAYGTTGGGTGEIAEWVAEELRADGLTVRLTPAAEVTDVAGYDALILGSALYGYGWHLDVRRFVHRFAGRFTDRPVWLFSSGPLDGSADAGLLPPVPHAYTALRELPAR